MLQEKWLESVYSDGSSFYVSNPQPSLGETVTVKLRLYEDAPVRHVYLRSVPNGVGQLTEMNRGPVINGLVYYTAELKINEYRVQYQFYILCDTALYYYNQLGITTYMPDQTYDFVLLSGYRQPSWVKNAVFYQIFPDRFCNGNPANDVQDGEYTLNGHPTLKIKDWSSPPLHYGEGFCLDFYGGDLEGVIEKIPYLKDLGVTAIYLNPIFLAPSVHKYDCIDYFHVDPHFGGDEALARLSDELHKNGMRLILDISINHTGTAHKWFNRDGLFFDKSEGAYNNPASVERGYYFFEEGSNDYSGWLGIQDLPTLNYTSQELRQIIYEDKDSVIRKWLKPPYNIDGWRFDVADTFARKDEVQLSHEIWPRIRECIHEENPDAYILAEDWGDCANYLQGKEWDSPMNYFGCGRVLREFVGAGDPYMAGNETLKRITYKMTPEDVKARVMQHLAKLPFVFWQNQFNLIDSHDVPRLHNYIEVNSEEYRGAVIMQFMLIGTVSVYYGDEAEAQGWTSESDGCRATFPWNTDYKATATWKMYQKLMHMKAEDPLFSDGGQKFLYAGDEVLALSRFTTDRAFIAIMSVSENDKTVRLPLSVLGAKGLKGSADVFGTPFSASACTENKEIEFVVKAHKAYLCECEF